MADIAKFDAAIVDRRNQAETEEETTLRQFRDDTAAFVKSECKDTSVNESVPQPFTGPF